MRLQHHTASIASTVERLAQADQVCCLTGAGISAESGIPTFRGPDGFWAGQRPQDLATPEAFKRHPERVWRFYLWRRGQLAGKRPNAGHIALATIERNVKHFTLVTQNVDDLHRLAGSKNIIELHGNLWIDRCTVCQAEIRRSAPDHRDDIPFCDGCGAMMRPGVVWFGEMLPPALLANARQASSDCEVMLVIGTSAVVQPAASLAEWAKSNGAFLVEINPDVTPLSPLVDVRFELAGGDILPPIAKLLVNR